MKLFTLGIWQNKPDCADIWKKKKNYIIKHQQALQNHLVKQGPKDILFSYTHIKFPEVYIYTARGWHSSVSHCTRHSCLALGPADGSRLCTLGCFTTFQPFSWKVYVCARNLLRTTHTNSRKFYVLCSSQSRQIYSNLSELTYRATWADGIFQLLM